MFTARVFATAAMMAAAVLPPFAARASTFTTLCSFGGGADGADPGQLVYDNGRLYGTTYDGGTGCKGAGCGVAFAVDAATGAKTTLHTFSRRRTGTYPSGPLIEGVDKLFGTTFSGGGGGALCRGGCGTLYSIDDATGAEHIAYDFPGGTAGAVPAGGLTLAPGMFYGATQLGGRAESGTVFAYDLARQNVKKIYQFKGFPDPALPNGSMVYDRGILYGTTTQGGTGYYGTVFELDPATGALKILHSFAGKRRDGALPLGGIAFYHGDIYGAAKLGGTAQFGAVFRTKSKTGATHLLYSFTNGSDGGTPTGGVIYQAGILYGTTEFGGAFGKGTIFQVNADTGVETVLYSFSGHADGTAPDSLISSFGVFYGTTSSGGSGYGTVFSFVP